MFNFGWAELLVIMALSVFVIGPKEIPEIMMTLGRFVRRLQYIKYAFTQQFEDFMQQHDLNEIRHYAAMQDHREGGESHGEDHGDMDSMMLPRGEFAEKGEEIKGEDGDVADEKAEGKND